MPGGGLGAPGTVYGAPPTAYGAPPGAMYAAPATAYGAAPTYAAPATTMGAPPPDATYAAPTYAAPAEGTYAAPTYAAPAPTEGVYAAPTYAAPAGAPAGALYAAPAGTAPAETEGATTEMPTYAAPAEPVFAQGPVGTFTTDPQGMGTTMQPPQPKVLPTETVMGPVTQAGIMMLMVGGNSLSCFWTWMFCSRAVSKRLSSCEVKVPADAFADHAKAVMTCLGFSREKADEHLTPVCRFHVNDFYLPHWHPPRLHNAQMHATREQGQPQYIAGVGTEVEAAPHVLSQAVSCENRHVSHHSVVHFSRLV